MAKCVECKFYVKAGVSNGHCRRLSCATQADDSCPGHMYKECPKPNVVACPVCGGTPGLYYTEWTDTNGVHVRWEFMCAKCDIFPERYPRTIDEAKVEWEDSVAWLKLKERPKND